MPRRPVSNFRFRTKFTVRPCTSKSLDQDSLRHLQKLPKLRWLRLENTAVTKASAAELKRALPKIQIGFVHSK